MDDFALKKRHTYGTILIDMETRKVVDLIESREVEAVSEWLKKFKNIRFFNRDGSQTYAKAISQSHPDALQISDYFHLIKNLCDYLKEYLVRKLPKLIEIEGVFCDGKILVDEKLIKTKYKYDNKWELIEKVKKLYDDGNNYSSIGKIFSLQYRTIRKYLEITKEEFTKLQFKNNEIHLEKQGKKQALINEVKKMYKNGAKKSSIAREFKLDFRTVTSYINSGITFENKNQNRIRLIDSFKLDIIELFNKNEKKEYIYNILKERGYNQSFRTFRYYFPQIIKEAYENQGLKNKKSTIKIKISKIISLLYKPINKIIDFSSELYEKITKKYEWIPKILNLVKEFKELFQEKDLNKFNIWLEEASKLNFKELNSFITGIRRDKTAIENAITYRFTNGLAEGSVNKLKTLKRTMYGKASFETLKRKLLWCEQNKYALTN
ncbi:MAG: ISL3 family transposase [Cetobacterium sp.]